MGKETFPPNADTMNALATGLGAVVFAIVRRLPPHERQAFANDLASMAKARSNAGDTTAETLLIDLHRAAVAAAGSQG